MNIPQQKVSVENRLMCVWRAGGGSDQGKPRIKGFWSSVIKGRARGVK